MFKGRQLLSSGTDRTDLLTSAKRRRLLHRYLTETHESRVRWPGGLAKMLNIRHFEVARKTGCKCIVGLFWERIFNKAANLSPKQSHNTLDNHLDPVSRATSKWRTATPLLAAAEADALGTEWSLHWNLSIPVACSKSLTFLPTVQVETGLWGWTINKDSFYFSFNCKRACQQF